MFGKKIKITLLFMLDLLPMLMEIHFFCFNVEIGKKRGFNKNILLIYNNKNKNIL